MDFVIENSTFSNPVTFSAETLLFSLQFSLIQSNRDCLGKAIPCNYKIGHTD